MTNNSRTFLITVKEPRNPQHNPREKQRGTCPVNGGMLCTDTTGEHHTVLVRTHESFSVVERWARKFYPHVTRIEEVKPINLAFASEGDTILRIQGKQSESHSE